MNRRDFLLGSAGACALAWGASRIPAWNENPRYLIGSLARELSQGLYDPQHLIAPDFKSDLRIMELSSREVESIPMTCFGHSFAQDPRRPEIIASASKWAHGAAVVDLKRGAQVEELIAPPRLRFFGHCAFAGNGRLYISAAEDRNKTGVLLEYDPVTWQQRREIPTGGSAPHEILILENNVALVANAGRIHDPPNAKLSWISLASGRILKTKDVPHANHLKLFGRDKVLIGNIFKQPGGDGQFFVLDLSTGSILDPKEAAGFHDSFFKGEALSLGVINDRLVATTTSDGNQILLWNLKENRISSLPFDAGVKGLIVRDGRLLVTSVKGALIEVSVSERGFEKTVKLVEKGFVNSSHIVMV